MGQKYEIFAELNPGNPLVEEFGNKSLLLRTDIFLKQKVLACAADIMFNDIIPAGFVLNNVIIHNKTANAVTITMGTTEDGTDIASATEIGANAIDTFNIYNVFSLSAAKDVYLQSANWNSASLDVYLNLEKILNFTTFTDTTDL